VRRLRIWHWIPAVSIGWPARSPGILVLPAGCGWCGGDAVLRTFHRLTEALGLLGQKPWPTFCSGIATPRT